MDTDTCKTIVSSRDPTAPLPSILVADDDPGELFFAMHLVKRTATRHPVTPFDNGSGVADYLSRAWLRAAEGHAQLARLLFLDLKMAGLGGFGFLEWIPRHPELSAMSCSRWKVRSQGSHGEIYRDRAAASCSIA